MIGFSLGIKSKLDAEIGFFLGCSYAELLMQFLILRDRLPNKVEAEEFYKMMKRRFPEITQQIKKVKKAEITECNEEVLNVSEIDVEPSSNIHE